MLSDVIQGDMVEQWLALSLQSKKVVGSNLPTDL